MFPKTLHERSQLVVGGALERAVWSRWEILAATSRENPSEQNMLSDGSVRIAFSQALLQNDGAHFRTEQHLDGIGGRELRISQLEIFNVRPYSLACCALIQ